MNTRTIFLMASIVVLSSCYEDKGNYDYSFDRMNSIDTLVFSPAAVETLNGQTIEFTQPLTEADTHKRIEVKVGQSLQKNTDQLDFKWIKSYIKDKKRVNDTLTTKGYLDVDLPVGKATNFSIRLQVYDKTTGLARYENFIVATRPIFKNSLFFLHGKAGSVRLGNIETVGATTNVRSDAYKLIYKDEANPFTDACKLMFQYGLVAVGRDFVQNYNLIVFLNNGTTKTYNPFGMESRLTSYKDFIIPWSEQGAFIPDKFGMVGDPSNQSDFYFITGKDGRFITARAIPSFKFPATEGSVASYNITAATITSSEFLMWDARNNRFLHVNKDDGYGIWAERQAYDAQLNNPVLDAHVDFSGLKNELSPVGKKALYGFIQYRENYEKADPYFIFYDATSQKYYLYHLTSTASADDKGDGESSDAPAYTIKGKLLEDFSPSVQPTIMYNTWFSTNYVFYADGADVVRYNINNGDKTVLYTAPNGYNISCMKFRSADTFLYSADLGRYLSIGMNKGDQGAVAEIKLNTASDIDESWAATFYDTDSDGAKLGNILDVQFVREYSYQLPTNH
ncbi:MAG: PKD-like family lipoprotein [Hoylesella enoeca]|uniref:PKD-like family lipoprotein n=1 Tax=Hoylesella enoeca TaxID=76123 RepID=UPI0028E874DC|nr:PKD-like family lipoprotein [Hoylesella enoeca]